MAKDSEMILKYRKYESKIIIKKVFEEYSSIKELGIRIINVFKWDRVFFRELIMFIFFEIMVKKYHVVFLSIWYSLLYLFHWIFLGHSYNEGKVPNIPSMFFHLILIFIAINLFFFERADIGFLEKKHLTKDIRSNLIGRVLELID